MYLPKGNSGGSETLSLLALVGLYVAAIIVLVWAYLDTIVGALHRIFALGALAIALCLLAFPAMAKECLPPEAMEIHVGRQIPDVVEKRLTGRDATAFLEAMAEMSLAEAGNPIGRREGDMVQTFASETQPVIGIVIYKKAAGQECLASTAQMSPKLFALTLEKAGLAGSV
jgi:hypothetical protein